MLIYSVVPPEVVFGQDGASPPVWEEVELAGGGRVILRREPGGRAVVERVISTEPRDYLDPTLQPGMPFVQGPRR